MGGLSRKYTTIKNIRLNGENPIILDAGDLVYTNSVIHDSVRDSEIHLASSIIRGYEKIGCDAINVGQYEMAGGLDRLLELNKNTSIPFISANLKDSKNNQLLFEPYLIINRDDLKIGVIGLTDFVNQYILGIKIDSYRSTGNEYINKIRKKVDVVVLLINSDKSTYKNLAEYFPDADLIYTSGSTRMTRQMMIQAEDGPFVYSCGREGRYLNKIKVSINNDELPMINTSYFKARMEYLVKKLERYKGKDPKKTLDEIYSDQPSVMGLLKETRGDIARMKEKLIDVQNSVEFQNIAMDESITDDQIMLEHVNESLSKYEALKNK